MSTTDQQVKTIMSLRTIPEAIKGIKLDNDPWHHR